MILTAAWVDPICGPPLRNAFVRIDGPRIVRIGLQSELSQELFRHEPVEALGNVLLLPGLINPHVHLELSCYRGAIAPQPLWSWLVELVRLRHEPGAAEREAAGLRAGAWKSLRAGVTCVGDISRTGGSWRGLCDLPIRKVCFVELLSLAAEPPRNLRELRSALRAIEENPLLTAGVSPHAPYTMHADDLSAAVQFAAEEKRPWCVHWLETSEERAWIEGAAEAIPWPMRRFQESAGLKSPHMSPAKYLEAAVTGAPAGALAHGNFLSEEDLPLLVRRRDVVVYCPRTHAYFGHPPHPLPKLLAAGVRVALGTDSLASNETLSVLDEARFVWQRFRGLCTARALLRMITLEAAAALGMESRIGSLVPDKLADLAAFPLGDGSLDEEPHAHLIAHAPKPAAVWIHGSRIQPEGDAGRSECGHGRDARNPDKVGG